MTHPGGMDAEIVAVVGVQHGPLVEGYEIRVKAGQDDALVCQLDLADGLFQRQYALFARVPPQNVGIGRIGVGDMPSSPGFSVATPCMVYSRWVRRKTADVRNGCARR